MILLAASKGWQSKSKVEGSLLSSRLLKSTELIRSRPLDFRQFFAGGNF